MSANGFPGNRVEAYRAGIIPIAVILFFTTLLCQQKKSQSVFDFWGFEKAIFSIWSVHKDFLTTH
jgi:hypothetical protein